MERNMDESRKAFEQWCKTVMTDDADFCMEWGDYSNLNVRLRWEAWQASRAAIEIDAPAEPFYPMPKENSPTDHYHYGRQSIISRVRAAGIKVKE
jgi:hypothetical protein